MKNVNIDRWVDGCKVRVFNWVDGKNIYVNIQYFASGSPISRPPLVDRSVLITANENGFNMVENFLSTLVSNIMAMNIKSGLNVVLTF